MFFATNSSAVCAEDEPVKPKSATHNQHFCMRCTPLMPQSIPVECERKLQTSGEK
jgi:hypothetical protein